MAKILVPLNPLKAFEAAARLESLTTAAHELGVSQVAVSRQVRVLEEYLGVVLFQRSHRSIQLTRDGKQLLDGISDAFEQINNAVHRVSRRGRRDILAIQSYTTFSQRWLIPRLPDFHAQNPNMEVRLTSSTVPADFATQNLDAAVRSGRGDWDGLHSDKLTSIELVPVCTEGLLKETNLRDPSDLSRVTLLHSISRPKDWLTWLRANNLDIDASRGLKFENSALAYEAALQGIGVAIGVKVLVDHYLRIGAFSAPFEQTVMLDEGYYLTWPRDSVPSAPLRKFHAWLKTQL
jgi:LysR family transcriptional regulator, glycine cleavage system transcriptional activator